MSGGIYNKYTGYHNRRSIRLRGYDYSQPGHYFVTMCTHHRAPRFGDVVKGKMELNDAGLFAQECLVNIPNHFPHVVLDQGIVMPNHVHAIITIRDTTGSVATAGGVGVQNLEPRREAGPKRNEFQHIIPKSLGSIVRGFKTGVTKWHRQSTPGMVVWQRNYYDHIIRDDTSLYFIRKYIRENPLHWIDASEDHIDREIDEFDMEEVRGGN